MQCCIRNDELINFFTKLMNKLRLENKFTDLFGRVIKNQLLQNRYKCGINRG